LDKPSPNTFADFLPFILPPWWGSADWRRRGCRREPPAFCRWSRTRSDSALGPIPPRNARPIKRRHSRGREAEPGTQRRAVDDCLPRGL